MAAHLDLDNAASGPRVLRAPTGTGEGELP